MRLALATLTIPLLGLATALAADDPARPRAKAPAAPVAPIRKTAATPAPAVTPEVEAEALAFVREHHPELARVLEPLRAMDPAEYRKAIGELSQVARSLAEVKAKNPRRYELALDAWK